MKNTLKVIICCISVFIYNSSFAQLHEALMLTVSSGAHSDQTAVRFLEEATDQFDPLYDAYKWDNPGMTPNLFTASDERYAINALCTGFDEKSLTLYFRGAFPGMYTLSAEEIGDFDSSWDIILTDKKLHTECNLRTKAIYTFDSQTGDSENRFELQFKVNQGSVITSSFGDQHAEETVIYAYGQEIMIQMESQSGTVFITDLLGREVLNATIYSAKGSAWTFSPGKEGMYLVNLMRDNKRYYKKVYVRSTLVL